MAYLGIDLDGARQLVGELRRLGGELGAVDDLIREGELLADLPTGASSRLAGIQDAWDVSAARIEFAVRVVEQFRVRVLEPSVAMLALPFAGGGTGAAAKPDLHPSAGVPQWDAVETTTWNDVHQTSSHNSYLSPGGVTALHDAGIRSFELDIHRGEPTDLAGGIVPWSVGLSVVGLAVDGLRHDGSSPGDWHVYHDSTSTRSEYVTLGEGLEAVAELHDRDPITVFIDNKDRFGAAHDGAALDALLERTFGARLFGPADLLARAPAAETLRDAVDSAAWPTVAELEGRVIVVLTDEVESYDRRGGRAFVATPPRFRQTGDVVAHVVEDDVVFHNADVAAVGPAELHALDATNSIIRTYFGPPCVVTDSLPNYRAVDVDPGGPSCSQASAP